MTRKEKEQKVLNLFGLKVGDKINFIENKVVNIKGIYEIKEENEFLLLKRIPDGFKLSINCLIDYDCEKVESPLKDRKCDDFKNCVDCPLFKYNIYYCQAIENGKDMTLEEICNEFEKVAKNAKQEILGDK